MTPEKVDELMGVYLEHSARCKFLEGEIELLNGMLQQAKDEMVEDSVTMSQAMTGMPHGSGTSDPTALLGMRFAGGEVTWRVSQIEEELKKLQQELKQKRWTVVFVDAWMACLNERERLLVDHKILRKETWTEISASYAERYNIIPSKNGMRNIIRFAMDKIYTVAG